MLQHTDPPPSVEVVQHVIATVNDVVEDLCNETQTSEPVIIDLVLKALQERTAPKGPEAKADPQEDAVEREIRREDSIKWAATCAVVALDANLDGSVEEYEHALSKVIGALHTKLTLSIQSRLLKKDIMASVDKLDSQTLLPA